MNYFDELQKAMTWLGQRNDTVFLGQSVGFPGTAMYGSLKEVSMEKRIELPVFEATQMGMSVGMALTGQIPISIFPRLNFFLCAISELVNHLDKYPLLSTYRPKVIVRVGIGSTIPLDPQWQHKNDFTEAIKAMCETVNVVRLEEAEQIVPAYQEAYHSEYSTVLVEVSDFLNQDFYETYKKFRLTYKGK
jgi:pyruvate/2-oxoglutarate/acetoin dehydrogenase E1 component